MVKLPEKEEGKEKEDEKEEEEEEGMKEQWSSPERGMGLLPAFNDTELLLVEPARNVREAEGMQACLPPPHESPGDDEDNTVSEAILSQLSLTLWIYQSQIWGCYLLTLSSIPTPVLAFPSGCIL